MSISLTRATIGALTATAAFSCLADAAGAQTFKGAVVHHNRRAHSFVVADGAGHLFAVHATRAPSLGSEVVVSAMRLRDGTYRLERAHRVGRAGRHVRVRGVVSYVDRRTGAFTVSAPGTSMLVVRSHRTGSRSADVTPAVGTVVVATGTIDDQGELEDQSVASVGTQTNGVDLEGTVLSVDQAAGTITVSADDSEQSGGSVLVTVPSTLSVSQFTAGEEVELIVQPTGAGTATLLGSADDESAQTANSSQDEQGDDPGSDSQGSDSQGSDSQGNDSQGSDGGQQTTGASDGSSTVATNQTGSDS
jgi:hypothetical protein